MQTRKLSENQEQAGFLIPVICGALGGLAAVTVVYSFISDRIDTKLTTCLWPLTTRLWPWLCRRLTRNRSKFLTESDLLSPSIELPPLPPISQTPSDSPEVVHDITFPPPTLPCPRLHRHSEGCTV